MIYLTSREVACSSTWPVVSKLEWKVCGRAGGRTGDRACARFGAAFIRATVSLSPLTDVRPFTGACCSQALCAQFSVCTHVRY